ncbi:MAG: hypothetical protein KGN00_06110 [Chloroflexota bacterium]|nr:hypothetical protein [Chloroflexota bacterium]MDE3193246.1 hypothetical protein [Chloroflexota bacterium]
MDIQQLRSWIFELYDPLENDRQYIVFDADRGNLVIDVPRYSERAVRLMRGTGGLALILVTNAARGREAARLRDALGVQVAAHEEDAAAIEGGADVVLKDDELIRPDARVLRVRDGARGATVVLLRKAGGVLVVGDLDLTSAAAKGLLGLDFSTILAAQQPPIWAAAKDALLVMQRELYRPRKRFGILLDAPWDRGYKGRLEDKMYHNDPIVPREVTIGREAGMGPETLVVADTTREKMEQAPRPTRDTAS